MSIKCSMLENPYIYLITEFGVRKSLNSGMIWIIQAKYWNLVSESFNNLSMNFVYFFIKCIWNKQLNLSRSKNVGWKDNGADTLKIFLDVRDMLKCQKNFDRWQKNLSREGKKMKIIMANITATSSYCMPSTNSLTYIHAFFTFYNSMR